MDRHSIYYDPILIIEPGGYVASLNRGWFRPLPKPARPSRRGQSLPGMQIRTITVSTSEAIRF